MKNTIVSFIVITAICISFSFSSPISTRVGIRTGLTIRDHDPDTSITADSYSGTGMLLGLGMGTDLFKIIAIDMTPQYRSTNYARDEILFRRIYSYHNLYFPIALSIKGGMIPYVSPYISLGIGINIAISGTERSEFDNGSATERALDGGVGGFLILGAGAEIKLSNFRIVPEFMANMQPPSEDNRTSTNDYHVTIGFYYAP